MSGPLPTVAIVGAGASGVLAALHLLDSPGPPARVLLVERSGKAGRGVAFSTDHRSHLLNVPAGSMSAFERDPGHFARWLGGNGFPNAQDDFVPRRLFGQYLGEALLSWPIFAKATTWSKLSRDEVVDVDATGAGPTLVFAGRPPVQVDAVILATGVLPPRWPQGLEKWKDNGRCISDPWTPEVLDRVGPAATVTLLGTGLTAVDVLLALVRKRSSRQRPGHFPPRPPTASSPEPAHNPGRRWRSVTWSWVDRPGCSFTNSAKPSPRRRPAGVTGGTSSNAAAADPRASGSP